MRCHYLYLVNGDSTHTNEMWQTYDCSALYQHYSNILYIRLFLTLGHCQHKLCPHQYSILIYVLRINEQRTRQIEKRGRKRESYFLSFISGYLSPFYMEYSFCVFFYWILSFDSYSIQLNIGHNICKQQSQNLENIFHCLAEFRKVK